jgi:hypothetical protein
MGLWHVLLWSLIIVGGLAVLYGVHRLCLWLEDRGWLHYKHKKPSSSAASCFVALQQFLEPPTQHVLQVKEEKRQHGDEEVPGQDESSPTQRNCPDTGEDQKPAEGNG